MLPFEADIGWNPRSPLDMFTRRRGFSNQSMENFRERLTLSLEDAAFAQQLAQARQAAYNARKYKPPV